MSQIQSFPWLKIGYPGVTGAGGVVNQIGDRTAATVLTQGHGKYSNLSINGQLVYASEQGAGVAPGFLNVTFVLGTTAAISLYNPQNSGVKIFLCVVRLGYISGTLGAGTLFHCVNNSTTVTAPTGGTALTASFTQAGNTATPLGVAKAGSTVVQPTVYAPFVSMFAEAAATTNGIQFVIEDLDGEICLLPGSCYQLQAVAAAGTTPLVSPGLVWEEQKIAV